MKRVVCFSFVFSKFPLVCLKAKFCNKFDSMEVKLVQELPRQLVIHDNFIKPLRRPDDVDR